MGLRYVTARQRAILTAIIELYRNGRAGGVGDNCPVATWCWDEFGYGFAMRWLSLRTRDCWSSRMLRRGERYSRRAFRMYVEQLSGGVNPGIDVVAAASQSRRRSIRALLVWRGRNRHWSGLRMYATLSSGVG